MDMKLVAISGVMTSPTKVPIGFVCKECSGQLNVLTMVNGIEVCRRCAIAYSTAKETNNLIFHAYNIVWDKDDPSAVYITADWSWHPKSKKCDRCAKR